MRTIAILLISSALLIIIVSCKPKQETKVIGTAYVTAKPNLRIRSNGSLKGKVLGAVAYGKKVDIIAKAETEKTISGKKGAWTKIKTEKSTGWVFGGFLSSSKPEPLASTPSPAFAREVMKLAGVKLDTSKLREPSMLEPGKPKIMKQAEKDGVKAITISPTQGECNHYGASDCYSFLIGTKTVSDFARPSIGEFHRFEGDFAVFMYTLGEGDGCSYGGVETITAINIKTFKEYSIKNSISGECKNCKVTEMGPECTGDDFKETKQVTYKGPGGKISNPAAELSAIVEGK